MLCILVSNLLICLAAAFLSILLAGYTSGILGKTCPMFPLLQLQQQCLHDWHFLQQCAWDFMLATDELSLFSALTNTLSVRMCCVQALSSRQCLLSSSQKSSRRRSVREMGSYLAPRRSGSSASVWCCCPQSLGHSHSSLTRCRLRLMIPSSAMNR